jgi:Tfp pilus assembly protein PilZ
MSALEKRNYPRVEVRWPVLIQDSQGIVEGVVRDARFSGAFIECPEAWRFDKVVELVVKVPEVGQPLNVTAEVIRPNIHLHGAELSVKGLGVQFKNVI